MRIALINENSQAAKNSIIEASLRKVVEPMGFEVRNYGMYAADDEAQVAAYKEAEKILSDTAANVYIQDLADFVVLNPAFTGYEFYPLYAVDFSKIRPA